MTGSTHKYLAKDGERTDHYIFLATIREAKLLCKEKSLLLFYANAHNWKEGAWSFYSEQRICSMVSMSPKTFRKVRSRLAELGWVVLHDNGYRETPNVELCFGNDDPHYEGTEWAKWWQPTGKRKGLYGNPVRPDKHEGDHLPIGENEPS